MKDSNAKLYTVKEFQWTSGDIEVLGITITHDVKNQLQTNFDKIKSKIKVVLESWGNRHLSLMGKKVIINSLVGSLFPYNMSVLNSINVEMIKDFENMIRKFIWNDKRDKISFGMLKKSKEVGGIKIIDLYVKDVSTKISWIKRIHQNSFMCKIAENYIPHLSTLNEKLWACNINEKDIRAITKESFYRDVWLAWSKINHKSPSNLEEILNETLWLNSFIRVNDGPVVYKNCIEKDLLYIKNLLNDNGEIMNYNEFVDKYGNIMNYVLFYGLLSAIPAEWKQIIRNKVRTESKNGKQIDLFKNKNISKLVYNRLIENQDLTYVKSKFEINFETNINIDDYQKSFLSLYKVTTSTKLRSFQYRLLQSGLVTNKQLHKWKIIDSPLCSFCKNETENISHLFIKCDNARRLWSEFKNWIRNKGFNQVIDTADIALNNIDKNPKHILNLLALITMQYIYRCRCLKVLPNFQQLVKEFEEIYKVEKYIAYSQNKTAICEKKWSQIFD